MTAAVGFTIDGGGVGWSLNRFGQLYRLDLTAGTATTVGTLTPALGGFKDLAYDALNDRVLALRSTGTSEILEINTATATTTSLGVISLAPAFVQGNRHLSSMALGPNGEIIVADYVVFDVVPNGSGFFGTPRAVQTVQRYADALGMDPLTGRLYGGTGFFEVLSSGAYVDIAAGFSADDIEFVPLGVPTPGSAVVLGISGMTLLARRRRRGG